MFAWLISNAAAGAFRWFIATVIAAVCLVWGLTPEVTLAEWLGTPPAWVINPWTRLVLVAVGVFVIIGLVARDRWFARRKNSPDEIEILRIQTDRAKQERLAHKQKLAEAGLSFKTAQRDVWLSDAIWRGFLGKWERPAVVTGMFSDEDKARYKNVIDEIRQKAFDGELPVWGKSDPDLWLPVPTFFWRENYINELTMWHEKPENVDLIKKRSWDRKPIEWRDLMTSRTKVDELWPLEGAETKPAGALKLDPESQFAPPFFTVMTYELPDKSVINSFTMYLRVTAETAPLKNVRVVVNRVYGVGLWEEKDLPARNLSSPVNLVKGESAFFSFITGWTEGNLSYSANDREPLPPAAVETYRKHVLKGMILETVDTPFKVEINQGQEREFQVSAIADGHLPVRRSIRVRATAQGPDVKISTIE